MKILYLWLFISVTASIFWSCSNNSSNSQSEDYYVEEVTLLDSTVCEEVVVVDVDGMAECVSDSALDKSGYINTQQPEKLINLNRHHRMFPNQHHRNLPLH